MEVSMIGLDLAKHVFHAHGADASGAALFSKQLRRGKVLEFSARKRKYSQTARAMICGGKRWFL